MATEATNSHNPTDIGFPAYIRREAKLVDSSDVEGLKEAAKLVSQGEVVISPVAGVMGFVCDATQQSGIEQIYDLKDREHTKPLIAAGSYNTRQALIDKERLALNWRDFDFGQVYDIPVFVIFPARSGLPKEIVMPDPEDPSRETVAIWWANYYAPTRGLEYFMQYFRPEAFIGGSSCNKSEKDSITTSNAAFREFGRGSERVPMIIYDRNYDAGQGMLNGSHTMLRVSYNKIALHRPGSVHTDSFKGILKDRFLEPSPVQNELQKINEAVILNTQEIRGNRDYYRR